MQPSTIDEDIVIFCISASSFPDGVMDAHKKIHDMFPMGGDRRYFAISRPNEQGQIVYKAAAEKLPKDEGLHPELETFTIKKGEYMSIGIQDFMKDTSQVGRAFQQLLKTPNIDPQGYCLEWYMSEKDMMCLVPLKSK